jgi:putative endonuclease
MQAETLAIEAAIRLQFQSLMHNANRFVYILRSEADRARYYVGLTSDVRTRLATHNSGGSQYTASHRPWQLVASVEFPTETSAINFERYLKTGSGRAFAKRHFV